MSKAFWPIPELQVAAKMNVRSPQIKPYSAQILLSAPELYIYGAELCNCPAVVYPSSLQNSLEERNACLYRLTEFLVRLQAYLLQPLACTINTTQSCKQHAARNRATHSGHRANETMPGCRAPPRTRVVLQCIAPRGAIIHSIIQHNHCPLPYPNQQHWSC